jgi:hypothetical protein
MVWGMYTSPFVWGDLRRGELDWCVAGVFDSIMHWLYRLKDANAVWHVWYSYDVAQIILDGMY